MGWVWDGLVIEISGSLDGWVAGYVAPSNSLLLICILRLLMPRWLG